MLNKEQIINKITNPKTIQRIVNELIGSYNHEVIQKPRLCLPENKKSNQKVLTLKQFLELYPCKDEEDYFTEYLSSNNYYDNESSYHPYLGEIYKRDTIITGASVTSKILEICFDKKTKINDIDLFYYQWNGNNLSEVAEEHYNLLDGEESSYGISKVSEIGILNVIRISVLENFSWQKLIESYDLNYAQVAIELSSGKIYFTDEFIDFLEHQLIRLTKKALDSDFPLTSFVRGVHKSKDFNCSFYIKDYIKPYVATRVIPLYVQKNLKQILITTNEALVEDGVDIVSKKRFKYWKENEDLIPFLTPIDNIEDSEDFIGSINIKLPEEPWVNICKKLAEKDPVSYHKIVKLFEENIPNFYNVKQTDADKLMSVIDCNFISVKNNSLNKDIWTLFLKHKMYKQSFSIQKMNLLKKFSETQSHLFTEIVLWFIKVERYDINHVLNTLIHVKNLDNDLIGVLENHFDKDIKMRNLLSEDFSTLKKTLMEIYQKELKQNLLKQPININPFKKYVKEIYRMDHLQLEGKKMNHCVAGYASSKIRNNECLIFHIEAKGYHSTLEVEIKRHDERYEQFIFKHKHSKYNETYLRSINRKNTPKSNVKIVEKRKKYHQSITYVWKQHQARFNENPHKINNQIAKRLIDYLNKYQNKYIINFD